MDYPWQSEPDEAIDRAHGFELRMRRNLEMGTWLGYVVIPPAHPWHGVMSIDDPVLAHVEVHGGITYAGPAYGDHDVFVVGFDCGHAFDVIPMLVEKGLGHGLEVDGDKWEYRDLNYVRAECAHLAEQAFAAWGEHMPTAPQPDSTDPTDRTDAEIRAALREMRGSESLTAAAKPDMETLQTFELGELMDELSENEVLTAAAKGSELEDIADRLTLARKPGESDTELRSRILEAAALDKRERVKAAIARAKAGLSKALSTEDRDRIEVGLAPRRRKRRRHIVDDPDTRDPW